ncbi:MAG: hypothetical protein QF404_08630, partial [Planctomycetota bacterium]|nr:hypothetical protein [Planctomycetota bacterium]
QRKHVMSEGSGWCGGEDTSSSTPSPGHGGSGGAFTYTFYRLRTTFTHSTSHITKIKFRSASDLRDTSAIGNIRAGARVIVYGRTH